jgi:hypothetical protein
MKFNADYYSSHILDPLADWRRSQIWGSDRRLRVHVDNARPHIAKKVTELLADNGMKRAPRPPCTESGTVRLLPFLVHQRQARRCIMRGARSTFAGDCCDFSVH